MHTLEFALLGLAVGTLGTLIGAGGGFLLLPVLVVLFPRDPPAQLTAISLCVVFANATSGSIAYARMRRVDLRAGLLFAAAGLPGAIAGAILITRLDHRVFDSLLGGVLLAGAAIIAFSFGRPARPLPAAGTTTRVDRDGVTYVYSPRLGLGALISVVVGFVSSLLGIGGGVIHVPLMVYALGFPAHIATATSHFVLACLSLTAVLVHAQRGVLAPVMDRVWPLCGGAVVGAQLGARLSSRIHARWILWGLAAALASVGVRLLLVHP